MGPRVQRASGFPCALFLQEGKEFSNKLGRITPREREVVSTDKWCLKTKSSRIRAYGRSIG
jgi:hypothetical protein